ncbi:receptor-like cytosolic serine/threonine-protein kinase RBK2 [Dioscorea cayenensis subsp. rotundata]|uniref:non-specific serine/threonine protein kinase n=1 Tax=Dioscorea cayennensis subsp. rotundata TaxID=55577 RepID=A0AB40BKT2_DIOCR|nr:receptor-like cytosolic serine/threonine-protein kinase RBK2 [Dioscorea cayenensis subsp. rotundata]
MEELVKVASLPREKFFPIYRKKSVALSASAQDLRSLESNKETREAIEDLSPRGVLGDSFQLSDSCSSKASTSSCEQQSVQSVSSPWRGLFRIWKPKSMRRFSTFSHVGVPRIPRGRSNRESQVSGADPNIDATFCLFKPSWKSFKLSELQSATNNFSANNIIGKGGYAEVYKGCLENGQLVAVKKLTRGTVDERTGYFLSELGIIVHVNHPNTAKLVGFSIEGGVHLVFQLSARGSLASVLHGSKKKLDWSVRYKVAVGTAEGLEYLHVRCQRRIIHRDIKAANILLTEDFEPQISDFGLAKWLPDKMTHHTVSSFEGTFGYLAPEYLMHGIVDEKTDVYAFGVLLLELITGRKAVDSSQKSLVMWAKPLLETNNMKELVDPSLDNAYNISQLTRTIRTAALCIEQSSIMRPRMCQVIKVLRGDDGRSQSLNARKKPLLHRTFSEEHFEIEEYDATRYLNDMKQHKQLALNF